MNYDYSKLTGRIIEKYGTKTAFAKAVGATINTVSKRLRGKTGFRQKDIYAWSTALSITPDEIKDYFFTPKV